MQNLFGRVLYLGKIEMILIGVVLVIAISVYIIYSVATSIDTINFIKTEIARATSKNKRRYWKKKLFVTYIRILPFASFILNLVSIGKDEE